MSAMTLDAALLAAADAIESGTVDYDWGDMTQCNCGIVAKLLLGIDGGDLREKTRGLHGTWSDVVGEVEQCGKTGIPVPRIVAELTEAGMTPRDMHHLELLNDPEIRAAAGLPPCKPDEASDSGDPASVVKYLRAFAASARPCPPNPRAGPPTRRGTPAIPTGAAGD